MSSTSVPEAASQAAAAEPPAPEPLDPLDTDLHHFHGLASKHFKLLNAGEFTKVPKWSKKACNGKVYKYVWRPSASTNPDGELVVVKVMQNAFVDKERGRGTCDREAFRFLTDSPEDSLSEIGVYCFLREIAESHTAQHCPYVLQMRDAFRDEASTQTWLVIEHCGDDLFDKLQMVRESSAGLQERDIMRYLHQLVSAVCHLHTHNIGHRDISLENLLTKGDDLRLMDFGQAVLLRNRDGAEYRYFRKCGKESYRAPECYLPVNMFVPLQRGARVMFVGPKQIADTLSIAPFEIGAVQAIASDGSACQLCLRDGREMAIPVGFLRRERQFYIPMQEGGPPGSIRQVMGDGYLYDVRFCTDSPGQPPRAELYGYAAAPVDIFACGVAFFIMHSQAPPWRMAITADDSFRFVQQYGPARLLSEWGKPMSEQATMLLNGLLNYSNSRWTAEQALQCSWFEPMRASPD